jgi:hypothetical protein
MFTLLVPSCCDKSGTSCYHLVTRLMRPTDSQQVVPTSLLPSSTLLLTRLLSSQYQDVFALFVPSCCDKSGTSCYHLVTRLMTVTDLLQVVPTRLIQAVRNKLLRACCHQLVNNWEQAVRTHLVDKLWDACIWKLFLPSTIGLEILGL